MSLTHPQTLQDGSVVFLESGIREKLQGGDPALGWEGDPNLEVYAGPENRLYVWRKEDDGQYRLVARSAPGVGLDERLIRGLLSRDTRRGYDPAKAVISHNEKLHASNDRAGDDKLRDVMEKVYWAAGRDLGGHY